MKKRTQSEIMNEIAEVYGNLSPENLYCDGELSMAQAHRNERILLLKLKDLFKEFGREVSELESYGITN